MWNHPHQNDAAGLSFALPLGSTAEKPDDIVGGGYKE